MGSKTKKILFVCFLLICFIFINNSSIFVSKSGRPYLLAHRGLAQTFPMEGLTADTNTAAIIYEPEHPYLENTIASMQAAFAAGADIVELDIQLTKDGQFAVFHDWLLDYRTNGSGAVREYTLKELKQLDIGYGYTADNGRTYPFRGKGVGLMPALEEVLAAFPEQELLLHLKSEDKEAGEKLADYLSTLPTDRLKLLSVYGADGPIAVLQERLPDLRVMSKATMKRALLSYLLIGWTGYIPRSLRNTQLHLPINYACFLWGWPHRFVQRMDTVNTRIIIVNGSGKWSEGFDTKEDLQKLPKDYSGGIWTNRIDIIAPFFKDK
ncbi:MAG: glycerophosphodiester phosphodiesterase [Firmicutes bacterium]|nr:glycerophosphodiester phosphodiesterase [Bacillota bacterium]